ncbi:hypothetical protein BJV78DRAFT_1363970 [Lactifluus subvellereus]|nr:hypothetical protein BJV78DRAFT_1363970 [Lactifluus subvellereus]
MVALIPVDNTLGALSIGVILSAIVYGVTWQQVYTYYTVVGNNDRLFLRIFVALLMVIDSANMAFATHASYVTSITNFGDYHASSHFAWSIMSIGITGILLELLIQLLYVYRVYQLSKRAVYMPATIVTLCLTSFSFGLAFNISVLLIPSEVEALRKLSFLIASIAIQAACDVIITTSMVYYLFRNRSTIPRINSVLNLLTLYIITCGTLTTVTATACLVTLSVVGSTWIYVSFYLLQVRLYSCSFMSVLNSRDHIRQTLMGSHESVTTPPRLHFRPLSQGPDLLSRDGTLPTVVHPVPSPITAYCHSTLLGNEEPIDPEKPISCS